MKRWLLVMILAFSANAHAQGPFNVQSYGAVGDGAAASGIKNTRAFAAALSACYAAGGGEVMVPPARAAYHLASGIVATGNACGLVGARVPNWPGPEGPESQWTTYGSWIACDDRRHPCVQFRGSGYVDGIDFWHAQSPPSPKPDRSWLPLEVAPAGTQPDLYPWTIQFLQNFSYARNVQIANAAYGIDFEYKEDSHIGGTYSGLEHIWAGCFTVCLRFKDVNDTLNISDVHIRDLWFIGNANVVNYMEANLIGAYVAYLDNAQFNGVEFYKTKEAIHFSDGSAVYGSGRLTHAAENLQLTNVAFSQVVQAIAVDSGSTTVSANFVGVIGQSDTDTHRAADFFFDLRSDNADLSFTGMRISAVGHALMALGHGNGGRVQINGMFIGSPLQPGPSPISGYGYLGGRTPAFVLSHDSTVHVSSSTKDILAAKAAGPLSACGLHGPGAGSNCGTLLFTGP